MDSERLDYSFYESKTTLQLARALIGCELVHIGQEGFTSGLIVETEAYLSDDPACHAFNRRTPRVEPMYGPPGYAYVYHIYGMYQCFNIVSNVEGVGEAVLIRALQPVEGVDLMQNRLKHSKEKRSAALIHDLPIKSLCNGPGKLVIAMGISKELNNGQSLLSDTLYLQKHQADPGLEIHISKRIGISKGADLPYRFYLKDSLFVSKIVK